MCTRSRNCSQNFLSMQWAVTSYDDVHCSVWGGLTARVQQRPLAYPNRVCPNMKIDCICDRFVTMVTRTPHAENGAMGTTVTMVAGVEND